MAPNYGSKQRVIPLELGGRSPSQGCLLLSRQVSIGGKKWEGDRLLTTAPAVTCQLGT
jgi:hypothetical protein